MARRIQVQVDTQTHRENLDRDFKASAPVIVLTLIDENEVAVRRLHVAEASWSKNDTTTVYRHTPEFGAHVFVTVHGPVKYRYQGEEEWRTLEP